MASSSSGPKVSAVVDEEGGTVSIGVEHEGAFLPVASASLDYAKARNLSKKGEPQDEPAEEGGEG
jgi:hypothetical protein